jgi:hypothetical protein
MTWVLVAVGLVALGYGLHRAALWADGRGWIYYKTKPRFRGSSLGLIESVYNPAMEHVVEERGGERARGSQYESGDKPGDGDPAS